MAAENLLSVQDLSLRFGGLTAVDRVSFSVATGEIVSIIGPNGAGKTSLFNAITGVYTPTSGRILFRANETERKVEPGVVFAWLGIAVLTGVGLAVACSLQTIWQSLITDNYQYRHPFHWGELWPSLLRTIDGAETFQFGLPLLLGAALGGLGAISMWYRARRTPDIVTRAGLARTFQNIRLFGSMTVLENVLVGMDSHIHTGLFGAALSLPSVRYVDRESIALARELLAFVDLEDKEDERATNLPYGHQRRLEIARALATRPAMLLLDEPAAGMNPSESHELMELIQRIREQGITVLLIEHHMKVVMGISDRVVVLHYGNKIAEGTPSEIKENPRVIEAYLGEDGDHHG